MPLYSMNQFIYESIQNAGLIKKKQKTKTENENKAPARPRIKESGLLCPVTKNVL